MKRFLVVVCAVAVCLGAATVHAQTAVPMVSVYFDEYFGVTGLEQCPVEPIGTVYVVAENWDMWMQSIEYAIDYPAQMVWLGDAVDDATQLKLGSSPLFGVHGGIAVTWQTRGNGFHPLLIQTASIAWDCQGCTVQNIPVVVVQKATAEALPGGLIRALESPNFETHGGVGMTSYLCATVPVEETTWGAVKALYGN